MKVDYSFKSIKTESGLDTKNVKRPVGERAETPEQGGSASVQLSPLMSHVKQTGADLAKTPSFDQKRVDELRSAIAAGKFRINPDAIADRLLKTVGELIGTPG